VQYSFRAKDAVASGYVVCDQGVQAGGARRKGSEFHMKLRPIRQETFSIPHENANPYHRKLARALRAFVTTAAIRGSHKRRFLPMYDSPVWMAAVVTKARNARASFHWYGFAFSCGMEKVSCGLGRSFMWYSLPFLLAPPARVIVPGLTSTVQTNTVGRWAKPSNRNFQHNPLL
jgi:hypothetical protein